MALCFGISIDENFIRISYVNSSDEGLYLGICTSNGRSFSSSLGISRDLKNGYIGAAGTLKGKADIDNYELIDSFIYSLYTGEKRIIKASTLSSVDMAYLYFWFLKSYISNLYNIELSNAVIALEDTYFEEKVLEDLEAALGRAGITITAIIRASEAQKICSFELLESLGINRQKYRASFGAAILSYIDYKENIKAFIKDVISSGGLKTAFDSSKNPLTNTSYYAEAIGGLSKKDDNGIEPVSVESKKDDGQDTTLPAEEVTTKADYTRIDTPNPIIKASIDEKIIVNAGPGTGKTYSVIQRLAYIVNNDLAEAHNILVLCYSRAAVAVVRDRLTQEIAEGRLADEAYSLFSNIRTFDSFATLMMAEDLEEGVLSTLDYDDRINRFVEELQKDKSAFEGLEYLIVDELQDVVGPRAKMVKEILKSIDCGFMLLGDKCQAIYDYLIEDREELNSVRFYSWLQEEYSEASVKYELVKNQRQNPTMTKLSAYLRKAILSEDIKWQEVALKECRELLMMGAYRGELNEKLYKKEDNLAILCRNNGEAAMVSGILYEKSINHRILRAPQHIDLAPWIGDMLGDYGEPKIGHNSFLERAALYGYEDLEEKWSLLKNVARDENERVLDLKLLARALVMEKDIPKELDASEGDNITVSTIHKGKGREFNHVALLVKDFALEGSGDKEAVNFAEELKVAYVAITRTKGGLSFYDLSTGGIKQLPSSRWIRSRFFGGGSRDRYCSNIDIGYPEDVDIYSFVRGSKEEVMHRQKLIGTLKKGCELEARLEDNCYELYYEDQHVGSLSKLIINELWSARNILGTGGGIPKRLSGIYVDNVITVANNRYNEDILEEYNKSGLWLGLQLSGFARTEYK